MKLRNKITGEIKEDSDLGKMLSRYDMPSFDSISELCEKWEDVKEPLIKDPKIRKAVRAWAEASHLVEFQIANDEIDEDWCQIDGRIDGSTSTHSISFNGIINGADVRKRYTIEELCGSEE